MVLPDPDMVAFPDPHEIEPHAIAFAGMLFAHAALEREISALLDAITKTPGFGEQHRTQWGARVRPARIIKLIKTHRSNDFAQTKQIETLLNEAIDPYGQYNLLAHGTWWCFNRRTSTIVVRGATRRKHREIPPRQREYTADGIYALAERLQTIEAELNKVRRSIETPQRLLPPIEPLIATITSELNKLRRSIKPPANQDEKDKSRA